MTAPLLREPSTSQGLSPLGAGHNIAQVSIFPPSLTQAAGPSETYVQTLRQERGTSLDSSVRTEMESAFGQSFNQVRLHTGAQANMLNARLNADAVTTGNDVYVRDGAYQPGSMEGRRLMAHELAHVVQQGGSMNATAQASRVSDPNEPAEQRAERAARAVLYGMPVSDVGTAPTGHFYRAVKTNGGEFDTSVYSAFGGGSPAVGTAVGADIILKFTPNTLVEGEKIAMTQTVKTFRSTVAGGAVDDPKNARTIPDALTAADGPGVDIGRGIDRTDFTGKRNPDGTRSTLPNTNPLYGVHNTPADPTAAPPKAAAVSTALGDTAPSATAAFGSRKRKVDGTFEATVDAKLSDSPRRRLEFEKQEWNQTFETTALVLDGPMANTYLGSVEWGWSSDAAGTVTLKPTPIRIVRAGTPTSAFMDAATKWNSMSITDPTTGTSYDTVDLPTTLLGSGVKAAPDMTTKEILSSLAIVNTQLGLAGPGGEAAPILAALPANDKANKEFEKKALEAELRKRSVKLDILVKDTEDWVGSDHVYAKLTAPSGVVQRSETKKLNNGERHSFLVPLEKLLPLAGPVRIDVFDADWPDADDLLVRMEWAPPWDLTHNSSSHDDADYDVAVEFER